MVTESEIFNRSELLLGSDNMQRIATAKVLLVGVGGVGSWCAEGLIRTGIRHLSIVDYDMVQASNINRQLMATTQTLGQVKVDALKERLLQINPNADIRSLQMIYSEETADQFDLDAYDYVVDAIDTVTGKLAIIVKAKEAGVPVISAMGAGNKLDPTAFEVADIYDTSVCPLARVMRTECKKRNIRSLKVVYSKEKALKPKEEVPVDEGSKRRSTPGSVSFVPSVAGLIVAGEILNDLAKTV